MTWLMEILRIYQEIFNIAKNPNYDGNQQGLASKIHKMFAENTSVSSGGPFTHARSETLAFEAMLFVQSEIVQNKELAKELHKAIIKKFER